MGCQSISLRRIYCCLNLNGQYARTFNGILNILQIIMAVVIMGLMYSFCQQKDHFTQIFACTYTDLFYLLVVASCFLLSVIHFIYRIIWMEFSFLLLETAYEPLHYTACNVLYLASVIASIVADLQDTMENDLKIAATILGCCNSLLYGHSFTRYWLKRIGNTRRTRPRSYSV